jgi:hypothetical protein
MLVWSRSIAHIVHASLKRTANQNKPLSMMLHLAESRPTNNLKRWKCPSSSISKGEVQENRDSYISHLLSMYQKLIYVLQLPTLRGSACGELSVES